MLHRRLASDLGGGAPRAGVGTPGGDSCDTGHAQRPRARVGDGEAVRGYPLAAQCLSVVLGSGEQDLGGGAAGAGGHRGSVPTAAAWSPSSRVGGGDPAGRQEQAVGGSSTGGQPESW